jgi:uncharacterized protein YjaG (DUF416 family)
MAIVEINKLKDLDFNKQLAFAYLTCERLYPNYIYFSANYDFGNPDVLRKAIDYVCLHLFTKKIDATKINLLITNVSKNTPDTEDYATIFVSSALDACTTINESLDFLIDKKFSRIEDISTFGIDTVNMYIREIEAIDFNKEKHFQQKIDSHPLMQKEITIQSGIITFLCNSKTFDFEDLQTLLHLQENNKKGSLNL